MEGMWCCGILAQRGAGDACRATSRGAACKCRHFSANGAAGALVSCSSWLSRQFMDVSSGSVNIAGDGNDKPATQRRCSRVFSSWQHRQRSISGAGITGGGRYQWQRRRRQRSAYHSPCWERRLVDDGKWRDVDAYGVAGILDFLSSGGPYVGSIWMTRKTQNDG